MTPCQYVILHNGVHSYLLASILPGIEDSFAEGFIGGLIGIEGGHAIDSSLAALRLFYDSGVRYLGLTHNCNTEWYFNVT